MSCAGEAGLAAASARATGAVFLSGLGTIWLLGGVLSAGVGTPWLVVAGATGVCMLATAMLLLRRLPAGPAQAAGAAPARWFKWANIAQYVAIGCVVMAGNLGGRLDLIPAGTSLVVAIHFVPLAYAFDNQLQ